MTDLFTSIEGTALAAWVRESPSIWAYATILTLHTVGLAIVVGIAAMGAAGFLSLDALSDLSNVGSLAAFALVCITVIYLRRSDPGLVRPFRTPLYPVVPILGAVMCLILLMSLMSTANTRNFFLIYLVVGIALYFLYGMRNSKLGRGVIVEGGEGEPRELPHRVGEPPEGQG